MKKFLTAIILVLIFAPPIKAQSACSANCTLVVGDSFTLQADHDGVNTIGYRVFVDNAKVGSDVPMTALTSGVVSVSSLIAPARGAHTIQLAAFNEDNEVKSDPLSFTSKKKAPGKPGAPRVIITASLAQDGSIRFKVTTVDDAEDGAQ